MQTTEAGADGAVVGPLNSSADEGEREREREPGRDTTETRVGDGVDRSGGTRNERICILDRK